MASFELNPGERVFADTSRYTLQGSKMKFPVHCRCVVTDQRFVYFNMGKMAPLHFQLGFFFRWMFKVNPAGFLFTILNCSGGIIEKTKGFFSIATDSGQEVLLENFDKSLEWFQNALTGNGVSFAQTGEEEWRAAL